MNPRPQVQDTGMMRVARDGDGLMAFFDPSTMAVDANSPILVANMAGGLVLRTTATAARTDTTDTAVNILAAFPQMDIGEAFTLVYSNQVAFAITIAGGTGVTASGNLTIAANGLKFLLFTKLTATTMSVLGL